MNALIALMPASRPLPVRVIAADILPAPMPVMGMWPASMIVKMPPLRTNSFWRKNFLPALRTLDAMTRILPRSSSPAKVNFVRKHRKPVMARRK